MERKKIVWKKWKEGNKRREEKEEYREEEDVKEKGKGGELKEGNGREESGRGE